MSGGAIGDVLAAATSEDAQLLLSLLVWPEECPDPRLLDEWLRTHEISDLAVPHSCSKRRQRAGNRMGMNARPD